MIFQHVSGHDAELEHFLVAYCVKKKAVPKKNGPGERTEAVSFRHPWGNPGKEKQSMGTPDCSLSPIAAACIAADQKPWWVIASQPGKIQRTGRR
jgi:hypothetical protein